MLFEGVALLEQVHQLLLGNVSQLEVREAQAALARHIHHLAQLFLIAVVGRGRAVTVPVALALLQRGQRVLREGRLLCGRGKNGAVILRF